MVQKLEKNKLAPDERLRESIRKKVERLMAVFEA
jgi:hypothetical protein